MWCSVQTQPRVRSIVISHVQGGARGGTVGSDHRANKVRQATQELSQGYISDPTDGVGAGVQLATLASLGPLLQRALLFIT